MSDPSITGLLDAWKSGDRAAEHALIERVYPLLRDLAHAQVRRHAGVLTLAATELVHEAFERLHRQRSVEWQNRGHFLSIAATVIRRVIVDYLRQRSAEKRGGDVVMVEIDATGSRELAAPEDGIDWLALDQALAALAERDPACARVAEMRLFSGLNVEQIADVLGSSTATIVRQWKFARIWLADRLDPDAGRTDG
jgi:RNA polymerase sigma factor (TIGR02999 family)